MIDTKFSALKFKLQQRVKEEKISTFPLTTAVIAFVSAIIIGFGTRIVAVFQYVDFTGDMSRDLYIYQNMWQGKWPTLGPVSSLGLFHLPSHYYYFTWPITLLGPSPVWPAFTSALLSFGSIVLLGILIYRLLRGVRLDLRLLLSSLGSLWWSLLTLDIMLANRAWNPSPINFFLFLLVIIWDYLWHCKLSDKVSIFLWCLYSTCFVILTSLHASTFFVIPIFYLSSLAAFYLVKKNFFGPLVSLVFSIILVIPYFVGEIARGWTNTANLLNIILAESEKNTWSSLLNRLFFTFSESARLGYFLLPNAFEFATIFLTAVSVLSLYFFRGNKNLFYSLLFIFGSFVLISASFQGYLIFHYIAILWSMPLIFTILTLAYFPYKKNISTIIIISITVGGIALSMLINIRNSRAYLANQFGPIRLINTRDMEEILEEIPQGSTVCQWSDQIPQYAYIDQYIIRKDLTWQEYGKCSDQDVDYILSSVIEPDYTNSFVPENENPRIWAEKFYNSLYLPMVDTEMTEPGWKLWKDAHHHRIYIRN